MIHIPKLNAHMGLSGLTLIGYLRIVFAAIHLVDRILLGMDLDLFLSPTHGLLPLDEEEHGFFGMNSLLRNIEDDMHLWVLHWIGLINIVLLLLGIAPRMNAIALYFNNCSFHNANWMLCDGVDTGVCPLVRSFSFLFIFLPLHHVTIWDRFGWNRKYHNTSSTSSWPMWPVWLLQWQTVLVMTGAMVGKLDGPYWIEGTAMYYISSCTDEAVGIFNPDILFNTVLPSKILTWSALAVEMISPFTIWFDKTRFPTLIILLQIFIGMDVSMNMGTFEWYNMLGYAFFLIRSEEFLEQKQSRMMIKKKQLDVCVHHYTKNNNYKNNNDKNNNDKNNNDKNNNDNNGTITHPTIRSIPSRILHLIGYAWFLVHFISLVSFTIPLNVTYKISPPWLKKSLKPIKEGRNTLNNKLQPFFDNKLSLYQYEWTLFNGWYDGSTKKILLRATLIDGSVHEWRVVNWNNLSKWERKRYYNFLNYFKHLCDDDPYQEQDIFLEFITEHILFPNGYEMESLSFWTYEDTPFPYPGDDSVLGSFDRLRHDNNFLMKTRLRQRFVFEFTNEDRKKLLRVPPVFDGGIGQEAGIVGKEEGGHQQHTWFYDLFEKISEEYVHEDEQFYEEYEMEEEDVDEYDYYEEDYYNEDEDQYEDMSNDDIGAENYLTEEADDDENIVALEL